MGMKIDDVRRPPVDRGMAPASEGRREGNGNQREFRRHMQQLDQQAYEKHLEGLRDSIEHQGKIVARRMDLGELERYRALVAELLREVGSNAFRCRRVEQYDRQGRCRSWSIINRVNEKLEEMTREMLGRQTDNLRLLGMTEEIRGLLVDLLM